MTSDGIVSYSRREYRHSIEKAVIADNKRMREERGRAEARVFIWRIMAMASCLWKRNYWNLAYK
jgi:hypothetical protein